MSNALAIAAVTAVLRSRLENSLADHVAAGLLGETVFSALPPDRVEAANPTKNQLNLFLYRVTANPGWTNVELPARRAEGERLANPPLVLDLHYLMSAYGVSDLAAEVLLGYAMQVLHEIPVVPRQFIQDALAGLPAALQALATSGLAEQLGQIKIVPQLVDSGEMERLWPALQAHYRPSALYEVSAVLIESELPVGRALPVRAFNVYAEPMRVPVLQAVERAGEPGAPIVDGSALALRGQRLRSARTWVVVDGEYYAPDDAQVTDALVEFALPPGQLRAGLHALQVSGTAMAPRPEHGIESNALGFLLRPQVAQDEHGDDRITLVPGVLEDGLRAATIAVTLSPEVGRSQRVYLLLNELGAPAGRRPRGYSFPAGPWEDPEAQAAATIRFAIRVAPATYLVQIQVDGATSPLALEGGAYARPRVEIT